MLSIKQILFGLIGSKKKHFPKYELSTSITIESPLFRNCFISFLQGLDGANRSRSYASNLNTAKHIIDGLGHYRMNEINKDVLKRFINGFTKKTYMSGTGERQKTLYYSQSMIDKVYNLLHCFIRESSSEDGTRLLKIDYMANIKKPRSNRPKAPEMKPLSDGEIKMLMNIVREHRMINVWINLLLYTGTRPSEPLALKTTDIHFDSKTIDVFRTLSQEEYLDPLTQKASKPRKAVITDLKNERNDGRLNYQRRTLKVGDNLLDALRKWVDYVQGDPELMRMKKLHHTEEYLFNGPQGQLWLYDDYKQVYERLLKKHGLSVSEYTPYRFRHNCCTRLLRLGINLKAVQLIMGDNTADMVMKVYANLDKTDVLDGSQHYADSIDEALEILSN